MIKMRRARWRRIIIEVNYWLSRGKRIQACHILRLITNCSLHNAITATVKLGYPLNSRLGDASRYNEWSK